MVSNVIIENELNSALKNRVRSVTILIKVIISIFKRSVFIMSIRTDIYPRDTMYRGVSLIHVKIECVQCDNFCSFFYCSEFFF